MKVLPRFPQGWSTLSTSVTVPTFIVTEPMFPEERLRRREGLERTPRAASPTALDSDGRVLVLSCPGGRHWPPRAVQNLKHGWYT